jgi:hypothetical protein
MLKKCQQPGALEVLARWQQQGVSGLPERGQPHVAWRALEE